MSEMVERVALAIWRAREENLPPRVRRLAPDDLDKASGAWAMTLEHARAAIAAMREPTTEMWRASANETGYVSRNAWEAMIDAALADEPKQATPA
jgi:hypothetical protein